MISFLGFINYPENSFSLSFLAGTTANKGILSLLPSTFQVEPLVRFELTASSLRKNILIYSTR